MRRRPAVSALYITWCRSPSWKRPARGSVIKYCKIDRERSRRPRCWRWNRLGAVWTRRNSTASSKFTRARDSLPKQPRESCHSWKSARQYGDEVKWEVVMPRFMAGHQVITPRQVESKMSQTGHLEGYWIVRIRGR